MASSMTRIRMWRKWYIISLIVSMATLTSFYVTTTYRYQGRIVTNVRPTDTNIDHVFSWVKNSSGFEIRPFLLRKEISQDILKQRSYTQIEFRKLLQGSKVNKTEGYDLLTRSILSKFMLPSVKIENIDFNEFLSKPVINTFKMTYTYDHSSRCAKQQNNIRYIIAVPSAPGNVKRRDYVRQSKRAQFANDAKNRATMVFFTGLPDPTQGNESKNLQDLIDKEQQKYDDIVQANFVDTYGNITKKSALMLTWSHTFCSRAKFVIRTDDDVDIDIIEAVAALEKKSKQLEHFILGAGTPTKDAQKPPGNKYYVPAWQWPYREFPDFHIGGAIGLPVKTGALLLEAMGRLPFVWLDDVFVTGMCTQSIGVKIDKDSAFTFKHIPNFLT